MIERIRTFIQKKGLIDRSEKVLVAVSGGVDSMVLIHLLKELGYQVSVAHMNFNLRGEASDADESFVKEWCSANAVTCFTHKVDTKGAAARAGISIQMAARNLRYAWFEELCEAKGFHKIATAHHLNDSFETLLLNLTKGTGIKGLLGIPTQNRKVIRPLIEGSKEDILAYAKKNRIVWIEDASNSQMKYQRNLIRHEVIPMLQKINPSLLDTYRSTRDRMSGVNQLVVQMVQEIGNKNLVGEERLNMTWFDGSSGHKVILAELLRQFGVTYSLACEIGQAHMSGKVFLTNSHEILFDRNQLVFNEIDSQGLSSIEIQKTEGTYTWGNWKITLEVIPREAVEIKNEQVAYFDIEKIIFPLQIGPFKRGDWFIPLGMKGRKKVSDFMIDEKISLHRKERIPIFETSGIVMWVGGCRIDDRFKIGEGSEKVLRIELIESK